MRYTLKNDHPLDVLAEEIVQKSLLWARDPQQRQLLDGVVAAAARYANLPSERYVFSDHARERFCARTNCKNTKVALECMRRLLAAAKEVSVKERYRVRQLLNHHCQEARYFKSGKWMFVVVEQTVATCYRDEAGRWE